MTTKIPCRNPQLCRVQFHYSSTDAKCLASRASSSAPLPKAPVFARPTSGVSKDSTSPWGQVLEVTDFEDGISHVIATKGSGIALSPEKNRGIPSPLRRKDGLYEGSAASAIPSLVYPHAFETAYERDSEEIFLESLASLEENYPEEYKYLVTDMSVIPDREKQYTGPYAPKVGPIALEGLPKEITDDLTRPVSDATGVSLRQAIEKNGVLSKRSEFFRERYDYTITVPDPDGGKPLTHVVSGETYNFFDHVADNKTPYEVAKDNVEHMKYEVFTAQRLVGKPKNAFHYFRLRKREDAARAALQDSEQREFAARQARGIRGRFGTDIWGTWASATAERQEVFLRKYGIPQEQLNDTREAVIDLLRHEGGYGL